MKPSRKYLAVGAVVATAAFGTAGIAAAAGFNGALKPHVVGVTDTDTSTDTATDSDDDTDHGADHTPETELTGDTATKVTDAALAAVPGGTIVRVETDTDDGGAYEAHMTDASGNDVKVVLDANFAVIDTLTGDAGGHGGHDGDHGGDHGGDHADETPLTGDEAAKVTAAAQAAVPGGTVTEVTTESRDGAVYEAHVTDANGNEVKVTFDASLNVVENVAGGHGGRGGHGGHGRHGHDDADDTATDETADTATAGG